MRSILLLLLFRLIAADSAGFNPAHHPPTAPYPGPLISNVTVFQPPLDYTVPRTLYARTLQLTSGVFLATWENYGPNNNSYPYFPIYQSFDSGLTWSLRSQVYDTQNGWGLRYQPFLYMLPVAIGSYPAGTLLLSGSSIPQDLSQTWIEIYASRDEGYTWEFVSHVAQGGKAIPKNGETPVWEPFLLALEGQLIVFYSDQRDPLHTGQKLVHQVTSDLINWGPIVDDVAYPQNNTWRPGMTTISYLPGSEKWILTYEFYGAEEVDFAVYYRLSESPLTFDDKEAYVIRSTKGLVPKGSPYNVWTPAGRDANGTIVVSCGDYPQVFVNYGLAEPGSEWFEMETPENSSYTRSLMVETYTDDRKVLIVGGGVLGGKTNRVSASEIDVSWIAT